MPTTFGSNKWGGNFGLIPTPLNNCAVLSVAAGQIPQKVLYSCGKKYLVAAPEGLINCVTDTAEGVDSCGSNVVLYYHLSNYGKVREKKVYS